MKDNNTHERRRGFSRRRFLTAAGTSGVAVGLAGCLGGSGSGNGSGGGSGGNNSGGGNNTGSGSGGSGASGTVQWGIDPTQAQKNGEKIKQLFHDAGLSDDITLELVSGSQKTGSRQQRYNTILKSGEERPDMFGMDNGWTIPFITRGLIANLSEEFSQDRLSRIKNQYFDTFTSTARSPKTGDLYGLPFRPGFPMIHYRKDLVKQAGYKPDKNNWATTPMTWKKFAKITKDTMKQTGTKYGFSFQFDAYAGLSCCTFNEFMTSWGGAYFGGRKNLFGPIGKRPVTVAKKPVQKSLRMVRTFIHGKSDPEALSGYTGSISPTKVLSWTEQSSRKPFANGDAVMLRYWPTAIPTTLNSDNKWTKQKNYGTMPIPYAVTESNAMAQGTGGTTAALGGWHLTLNPNAANKQGALEVMKTAMKKQVQIGLFKISGWLPPDKKVFNSKAARQVKPMGNYLDTLKLAGKNAMPRPVTVVWPQERQPIYQQVNSAASQSKSSKAALKTVDKQITNIENSVGSS